MKSHNVDKVSSGEILKAHCSAFIDSHFCSVRPYHRRQYLQITCAVSPVRHAAQYPGKESEYRTSAATRHPPRLALE